MGVKREVTTKGDGKIFPHKGDNCTIHYTGTLAEDGRQFDSSIGKEAFQFHLGMDEVIKGWDVGVKKMSLGEKCKLKISSGYGYGKEGCGGLIPPNADLIFECELLEIERTGNGSSTCIVS